MNGKRYLRVRSGWSESSYSRCSLDRFDPQHRWSLQASVLGNHARKENGITSRSSPDILSWVRKGRRSVHGTPNIELCRKEFPYRVDRARIKEQCEFSAFLSSHWEMWKFAADLKRLVNQRKSKRTFREGTGRNKYLEAWVSTSSREIGTSQLDDPINFGSITSKLN